MYYQRGFTIIELLVVIVVIAIIAAIATVSYGGIQQRASNSAIQKVASDYYKALIMYKADNETYPSAAQTGSTYACLGDYSQLSDKTCANFGAVVSQSTFNTNLKPYLGTDKLNQLPQQFMYTNNRNNWWRGAYYMTTNNGQIRFVQYNSTVCPKISGTVPTITVGYDKNIICDITLP